MTRDRMRTMVLRNSRSIQKHGTVSYCDMRKAGCAFAWRSHVTKSCLSWDISDVTSCNALTSCRGTYLTSRHVTLWRHVVCRSDVTSCVALTSRRVSLWRHVFTSKPPVIRHIHVETSVRAVIHKHFTYCGQVGVPRVISVVFWGFLKLKLVDKYDHEENRQTPALSDP